MMDDLLEILLQIVLDGGTEVIVLRPSQPDLQLT